MHEALGSILAPKKEKDKTKQKTTKHTNFQKIPIIGKHVEKPEPFGDHCGKQQGESSQLCIELPCNLAIPFLRPQRTQSKHSNILTCQGSKQHYPQ
jgi:hypothetical protein